MKKYACVKAFAFFAATFFLCTVLFSCGKTSSVGKATEKEKAVYSNSAPVPRTAKMMSATADYPVYADMQNVFLPEGPEADFSSGEAAFSGSPADLQERKLFIQTPHLFRGRQK